MTVVGLMLLSFVPFGVAIYLAYRIGLEHGKVEGIKVTVNAQTNVTQDVVFGVALNSGYALVKLTDEAAKAARGRQ